MAAIAYLVSFEAISAYVVAIGAIPKGLKWYGPLLIATATAASAYLNAAHAPDHWNARLVAGAVPVAPLASVHLLVRLMVRLLALHATSATGATAAIHPTPPQRHASTSATIDATQSAARAISPRQSRRAIATTQPIYERLAATGQPVTWRQFAHAFDPPMPRRTAQRYLAHHQANSATAPSANGQQPPADPDTAP